MRKIVAAALLAIAAPVSAFAQEKTNSILPYTRNKGAYEVGVYGGVSMPLGQFGGTVGRANAGFAGELNFDAYLLVNNKLGLSVSVLYQQQSKDTLTNTAQYNFPIKNGNVSFYQEPNPSYRQISLLLGPIVKVYESKKIDVNVYARVGITNQHNPDFYQKIVANNPFNGHDVIVDMPYYAYNYDVPAVTIMTNLGLKVNYKISKQLSIGLKADYLAIPEESGNVGEMYRSIDWEGLKTNGITFYNNKDYDNNLGEFALQGFYVKSHAMIQALNFSVGVHYRF